MFKQRGAQKVYRGWFAEHRLAIATTTLIGTIVGAGILAMPYAIAKVGFLYGFLLIIALGAVILHLNLFTGEIVLRTRGQHQLTGYVEKYLGSWGKRVMTFSLVFSIYGALTAYLIGQGESFRAIFGGEPIIYMIAFFAIGAFIVSRGIKATGRAELILIIALIIIVAVIGLFSLDKIDPQRYTGFNPAFVFLPYGVILFAFMGIAAIPELQEELEQEKHKMKKAIIIGSIVPVVLYLVFTVVVVGIVGVNDFELLEPNQRIATIALGLYSHPLLGVLANLMAILSMTTSFLALATAMTEMYVFDFGLRRNVALALTLIVPALLAFFDLTTFIVAVGMTGAIAGGLDGILIMLTYWKAKTEGEREPEYSMPAHKVLGTLILIVFALGIIYQVWNYSGGP